MKNILKQVIEEIRHGNHDDAQIAFGEYISEKTSYILSENYGDSDFEKEVEMYIMNTEKYYNHARQLMADGADYSEWENLVRSVADEHEIYPEGEDDVYDTVQGLMRDKEMLGEEYDGNKKKDRNFVAKNMNKVNRAQTHRDKKNNYKRNPKHKNKKLDEDFDPHNMIVKIFKNTPKYNGYVSQSMDREDTFRRAKKVVSDIARKEGINMSVEDKHVTARYIANMEG